LFLVYYVYKEKIFNLNSNSKYNILFIQIKIPIPWS